MGLYGEAGRTKELVEVYRQHVAQYPNDTGALIVLIRLLAATGDPTTGEVVRRAAEQLPDNAFLQFLLFEHLQRTREPGALEALDRAIAKETVLPRKRAWLEQFLPLAAAENRTDLVRGHLERLAGESRTADEKLDVARKMIAGKLHEPALAVLEAAAALGPSAETGVEIELAAATAELGALRRDAAAARLDRLLGRLAADYWRRPEILHRRTALVKSVVERERMLEAARGRWTAAPGNDGAALELAQLLAAFEFRREALGVLLDAAKRLPGSEKIEKAALDLFDLLRDERGREAFLAECLRHSPDRQDLALARCRTLFLLGRRAEALAAWDALAAKLDAAARERQLLELARFLRRSAMLAEAADLFERAVALAPGRLELRRELAETWGAIGQKDKARTAFAGAKPEEAETESLLDAVQFFLKQEMLAEARSALDARLAREPGNFDVRLMRVTVAARLAQGAEGEKLIAETLPLADTDARYRRWLEGAIAFHEVFENEAAFLVWEQVRLMNEPEAWSPGKIERRLIFAEVAAANDRKAEVAEMLAAAIETELAPEVEIELRRRQLSLVENDPAGMTAAEEQLRALLTADPARADEYAVRLALLYLRGKRPDLAAPLLNGADGREPLAAIDLSKVADVALFTGLENALREIYGGAGAGPAQLRILERVTTLEPGNRGAWERWLTTLALAGDEERFRAAVQRLLAGGDRLPLKKDVMRLLRDHLLTSHWRSLSRLLQPAGEPDASASGSEIAVVEALPLLDAAGRIARSRDEWLWIAWTRAYALNRLGRIPARDEAIRELERVAADPPGLPPPGMAAPAADAADALRSAEGEAADEAAAFAAGAAPAPARDGSPSPAALPRDAVHFPDGLAIALSEARILLTKGEPPKGLAPTTARRPGLRGAPRVRWAFDTDRGAAVASVLPLDSGSVIILDGGGRVYCVNAGDGKLLWSRDGPRPFIPHPQDGSGYSGGVAAAMARPPAALHHRGRLFFVMPEGIECWSASDGKLVWRSSGFGATAASQPVTPSLFAHDGRVLVCDPVPARVTSLDAATGKAHWQRDYPGTNITFPLHPLNAGASYANGRILLYGSATRIIRADDGEVLYSFDPGAVRHFPISLEAAASDSAAGSPAAGAGASAAAIHAAARRGFGSARLGYGMTPHGFMIMDYHQRDAAGRGWMMPNAGQRMVLANAAAVWAGMTGDGGMGQLRQGVLHGDRLLLISPQGLRAMRLDLPFAATPPSASGSLIGLSGRHACVLSGAAVLIVDLDTGRAEAIPLPAATPEESTAAARGMPGMPFASHGGIPNAAVDGPFVYVSSGRGLAAYHVGSRQRIWNAEWPASVAPENVETPGGSPLPSFHAGLRGRGRGWAIPTAATMPLHYPPHGYGRNDPGRPGAFGALTAVAHDGVLYTTTEPSRVVALADEDEAPPAQ